MKNNPFEVKPGTDGKSPENVKAWEAKNFYERLSVPHNATDEVIKKSFRSLSMKFHPDTVNQNEALRANYAEVQKLLAEAYNALKNPKERQKYDAKIRYYSEQKSTHTNTQKTERPVYEYKTYEPKKEGGDTLYDFVSKSEISIDRFQLSEAISNVLGYIKEFEKKGLKREALFKAVEQQFMTKFRNLSFTQLSRFGLSEAVSSVKSNITILEKIGLKEEQLLPLVTEQFINQFISVSYTQLDRFGLSDAVSEINSNISHLKKLKIERRILLSLIEREVTARFVSKSESSLDRFSISDAVDNIKGYIKNLESLNIPKEILIPLIEDTTVSVFYNKAVSSVDRYSENEAHSNIKRYLSDLQKIGVNKNKLLASIRNLTFRSGQKVTEKL